MSWLLDTNSCSYALRNQWGLREAIGAKPPDRLYVSAITVAEAWAGSLKARNRERLIAMWSAFLQPFSGRILPFDEAAAIEYGTIRAHLETRGEMIGDRDCMLAAIAFSRGLTVVTRNVGELSRVPGLEVEDWARLT